MVEPSPSTPKRLPDWLRDSPPENDGAPPRDQAKSEGRSEGSNSHPPLPSVPTGDLEEAMPSWLQGESDDEAQLSREPELGELDPTSLVTSDDLPVWLKALGRQATDDSEGLDPSLSRVAESKAAQPQQSQEPERHEPLPPPMEAPSDQRILPLSDSQARATSIPPQRGSAAFEAQPAHRPPTGHEVVARVEGPSSADQRPIVSSRATPQEADDGLGPIIFLGLVALVALIIILYVATIR
jgi:hypothetical protein